MNETQHLVESKAGRKSFGNLADVANPFDFANPVSKEELFIGRKKELEDIRYYLKHASNSDRTINLAILGDRAAGKTSLLNIISLESKKYQLIPVRIDLNESDVDSHLAFWFKLFGSIFTTVVSQHLESGGNQHFGGTHGKTYETYLDLISTYEIPDDKTFCPFLFPVQYAKAMSANNTNARVSDQIIKMDLKVMADEVKRPLVILIDECNILSKHRPLLEMVRNTFMNLKGFMLVFTGTSDLFPVMDEVFSPIIRQFKRIEVKPFAKIKETNEAILEPLKKAGLENLFRTPKLSVKDVEQEEVLTEFHKDLFEIHQLTSGRPYEIQLICHFMFKRVQQQKETRMRVSLEVLEDVLDELRQSHGDEQRPIIKAVKTLDEFELEALSILIRSDGETSWKEIANACYFALETDLKQNGISEILQKFVSLGIFKEDSECLHFEGDDFDKIVCKYIAHQRGIQLLFRSATPISIVWNRVKKAANQVSLEDRYTGDGLRTAFSSNAEGESEKRKLLTMWNDLESPVQGMDLLGQFPSFVDDYYYSLLLMKDEADPVSLSFLRFSVEGEGDKTEDEVFFFKQGLDYEGKKKALNDTVKKMKVRGRALGFNIDFMEIIVSDITRTVLFKIAETSGRVETIKTAVELHCMEASSCYFAKKFNIALDHAFCAIRHLNFLSFEDRNTIGYIMIANGRYLDAQRVLNFADSEEDYGLQKYNLAIAKIMSGEFETGKTLLNEVVRLEVKTPRIDVEVLFFVHQEGGSVRLIEKWSDNSDDRTNEESINLGEAASIAIKLIEELT